MLLIHRSTRYQFRGGFHIHRSILNPLTYSFILPLNWHPIQTTKSAHNSEVSTKALENTYPHLALLELLLSSGHLSFPDHVVFDPFLNDCCLLFTSPNQLLILHSTVLYRQLPLLRFLHSLSSYISQLSLFTVSSTPLLPFPVSFPSPHPVFPRFRRLISLLLVYSSF